MTEDGFITAVIVGLVALVAALCVITYFVARDSVRQQAVDRGFALYYPADGRFAWDGECD